jgi:hypothetical protein
MSLTIRDNLANAPAMIRTFIDDDTEAHFARDGYVVLTLFSPEEAAALHAKIAPLMPDLATCAASVIKAAIYDPANPDDEWIYRLSGAPISAALLPLMADMETGYCTIINKPAGFGALVQHVHPLMQLDQRYPIAQCWCALTDVDETNGAMQLLPGSHKLLPFISLTLRPDYYWPFVETLPARMQTISLKAGQALIFEDSIIHGSASNATPEDRLVLSVNFINRRSKLVTLAPAGEGQLEVLNSGGQFNYPNGLDPRSRGWESLGFIDDVHHEIDEAEFDRLIASGKKFTGRYPLVPRRVPAPPPPQSKLGILTRVRRLAGRTKRYVGRWFS